MTQQGATEQTVRESTRGAAFITLAKMYFLVMGFAQPVFLTRFLGSEGYGLYGVVLNVVSILNNVVVAGSIQAMSHAVTRGGPTALRRVIALHALLGLVLGGGLFVGADVVGAGLLHDPRLPPLLRIGAIIVANYSVYAALVGALNGQRRFRAQAGLDVSFATLRTGLVIGLAAMVGVTGSIMGFAIASGFILVGSIALNLRDLRARGDAATGEDQRSLLAFSQEYGRFFVPVLLYQLALNLVLQSDLLVLKAVLSRTAGVSAEAVNALAGGYKAVQNFAFLPYQLLIAVTFVIFPVVSRATLDDDRGTTERFIRGAGRFSTLALGAMLAVLAGLPQGVLRIAYKPPFDEGWVALRLLSIAQGAFALTVVGTTVILASGRTAAAIGLMTAMLAAVFAGDLAGIALGGTGPAVLTGLAGGTLFGCVAGLALVAGYVTRRWGGFIAPRTLLRAALGALVAGALAARVPVHGKVGTLLQSAVAVMTYLAALFATRELGRAEIDAVRRVIARRRGAAPQG